MDSLHIDRVEPVLPGLNSDYFKASFTAREVALRESLHNMYVQSEDHRDKLLPLVRSRYEVCHNLALFAGIPVPTPLMDEAEQALGIVRE